MKLNTTNITTQGVPYDQFNPGSAYRIGASILQITEAVTPCTGLKNLSYVGWKKVNAFIKTMVERRGWYAQVLQGGRVSTGDTIEMIL